MEQTDPRCQVAVLMVFYIGLPLNDRTNLFLVISSHKTVVIALGRSPSCLLCSAQNAHDDDRQRLCYVNSLDSGM